MKSSQHLWPCLLLLAGMVFFINAPIQADEVQIPASKDNSIFEEGDLSNGTGDYIFAGQTDLDILRRALIYFDVAASIPAGATITNVSLALYLSRTRSKTTDQISLHRLLDEWGEGSSNAAAEEGAGAAAQPGDVTWTSRFHPTDAWSTPGGVFVISASATTGVDKNQGFKSWSSPGMVNDVQAWLDNPAFMNFGWILRGNESDTKHAHRFNSREFRENPSLRPILTVGFTPPANTGACCLPDDGSCLILTASECSARGGQFQGTGTGCDPNPCPQPPKIGACCFDDGSCEGLTAEECATRGGTYQGDDTECRPDLCPVVLTPYVDPLPIPPVMSPTGELIDGIPVYDMAVTEFYQQLHRDLPPTRLWGYAGSYPGPTIQVQKGQPIYVNWINDLRDVDTGEFRTNHFLNVDLCPHGAADLPRIVTHLHGGHVPPESDGYPEDHFMPGESARYHYPNNQPAATIWYHDHSLGITRLNVYMGMAGFYLIRDPDELALDLPRGNYDLGLAIQDRKFKGDGSLNYPSIWQDHFFGDKMLVNGKVWPYLEVDQGKYRFRLLNGCNSRVLNLSFSESVPLHHIGSDMGLLPAPVSTNLLLMAPGERMEIIADFASFPAGTEIIMTNDAPSPYPGTPGVGIIPNVMKFIVTANPGHTSPIPESLIPVEPLAESEAVQHRELILRKQSDPCSGQRWSINDLEWDDITEFPILGTSEVWSFVNSSGVVHPMHMHLVLFQVLDRQAFIETDGAIVPVGDRIPPPPEESGWKDTVRVNPNEIARIIMRFEDYTGTYPYHCHILEHEDHEMMRQFTVLPPPEFTGIEIMGSDVFLRFNTTPNRLHVLEQRALVNEGSWNQVTNNFTGTGLETLVVDQGGANDPERYYRVRLLPESDPAP